MISIKQLVEAKPGNSERYPGCVLLMPEVSVLFSVLIKLVAFLFQNI